MLKRILLAFAGILFIGPAFAQSSLTVGTTGSGGSVVINGQTSGSTTVKVPAVAGSGTVFQLPPNNGANLDLLQTDGAGGTSWVVPSGGGSTTFPALSQFHGGVGTNYTAGRFYSAPWATSTNSCIITALTAVAEPFVATANGTVQSLAFDLTTAATSGSWNVTVAIYSDNSGMPGNQLASSASTNYGAVSGAKTQNLLTPLAITKGTLYWLVFLSDTTSGAKAAGFPIGALGLDPLKVSVWGAVNTAAGFTNASNDEGWQLVQGSYTLPANGSTWNIPTAIANSPAAFLLGF